jgi:hypothetical protein
MQGDFQGSPGKKIGSDPITVEAEFVEEGPASKPEAEAATKGSLVDLVVDGFEKAADIAEKVGAEEEAARLRRHGRTVDEVRTGILDFADSGKMVMAKGRNILEILKKQSIHNRPSRVRK